MHQTIWCFSHGLLKKYNWIYVESSSISEPELGGAIAKLMIRTVTLQHRVTADQKEGRPERRWECRRGRHHGDYQHHGAVKSANASPPGCAVPLSAHPTPNRRLLH